MLQLENIQADEPKPSAKFGFDKDQKLTSVVTQNRKLTILH